MAIDSTTEANKAPLSCLYSLGVYGTFGAIMFDVTTSTTISCSQGMQYKPVLSPSFLGVYEFYAKRSML